MRRIVGLAFGRAKFSIVCRFLKFTFAPLAEHVSLLAVSLAVCNIYCIPTADAAQALVSTKFGTWDANGHPLTSGYLYFYEAGSTKAKTLYLDRALKTPAPDACDGSKPFLKASDFCVELDARGEAPQMFFSGKGKVVLKDRMGSAVYTVDDVLGEGGSVVTYRSLKDDYAGDLGRLEKGTYADGKQDIRLDTESTVSRTMILDPDVNLIFAKGSKITVPVGKTLTISGPVQAGRYQIFDGLGQVRFAPDTVDAMLPEWWKDNALPGITDMTKAIQQAINACVENSAVVFAATKYLSGSLAGKSGITLSGNAVVGENVVNGTAPILKYSAKTGDFITLNGSGSGNAVQGMNLKNLAVDGNGTSGAIIRTGSWRGQITGCDLHNAAYIVYFAATDSWAGENIIDRCLLHGTDIGIYAEGIHSTDNIVSNSIIFKDGGKGTAGIKVACCGGWNISNNHIYGGFSTYLDLTGFLCVVQGNFLDNVDQTGIHFTNSSAPAGSQIVNNAISVAGNNAVGILLTQSVAGKTLISANTLWSSTAVGTVAIKQDGAVTCYGDVVLNTVVGFGTAYSFASAEKVLLLSADQGGLAFSGDRIKMRTGDSTTSSIINGFGLPEGVVTAGVGSLYLSHNTQGDSRQVFFKQSGTGNTGWIPLLRPCGLIPKGADTKGTTVQSASGAVLGPNTGFLVLFDAQGKTIYVPYWDNIY